MARFERPAGAIADYADLKVGDHLWKVCGIWPPFLSGPFEIVSTPAPFRTHREYSDIHAAQADKIVFDYKWSRENGCGSLVSMEFAADGNLVSEYSGNDNYFFRSEKQANDAVAFLRAAWEGRPDLISQEIDSKDGWLDDSWVDYDSYKEA